MDSKLNARSSKKTAGSGTASDRKKKTKSSKKKDKRKLSSLKGADSTDIPSPELDSEVAQDGDVTLTDQDVGSITPVGRVTKLPMLSSQSSVSLTTQVLPDSNPYPPRGSKSTTATTTTSQSNSAPLTRKTTTTTTAIIVTGNDVDGVVARVANLNVKQRSTTKQRSKNQTAKSSKAARNNNNNNVRGGNSSQNNTKTVSSQGGGSSTSFNESLRWDNVLEDTEQERERITAYKIHRRKRYLAAAQAKGLRWALNYNMNITASPTSEDSGVEMGSHSSGLGTSYVDFGAVKTVRSVPVVAVSHHMGLQQAFVEC